MGLLNDFVQRPGQEATAFSPNDTIIGVKDTSKLGGGMTVVIENINGTGEAVAQELLDILANKTSI